MTVILYFLGIKIRYRSAGSWQKIPLPSSPKKTPVTHITDSVCLKIGENGQVLKQHAQTQAALAGR